MQCFCYTTSSHRRCSVKKGVLSNFAKFTGKHLYQILFLIELQASSLQSLSFNEVASHRPATLLKKRLRQRYFSVDFTKFIRTSFLQKTSEQVLLTATRLNNCLQYFITSQKITGFMARNDISISKCLKIKIFKLIVELSG